MSSMKNGRKKWKRIINAAMKPHAACCRMRKCGISSCRLPYHIRRYSENAV